MSLGDKLYDRLPGVYKKEDAAVKPDPYPLKRLFQIMGVSFDYLKDKMDGHMNLYDPDKCPVEFLPYLFQTLGFDHPYFLSESEQRSFLKALPTLYQYKGTPKVFMYLARNIFGADCDLSAVTRVGDKINIDLNVLLDGSVSGIDTKTANFRFFADKFRPVNRKLNVVITLFYGDEKTSITLEWGYDEIAVTDTDTYSHTNLVEAYAYDVTSQTDDDYLQFNRGANAFVIPFTKNYSGGTLNTSFMSYYTFSGTKAIATNQPLNSPLPGCQLTSFKSGDSFVVSGYTNLTSVQIYHQGFDSSNSSVYTQVWVAVTPDANGFFEKVITPPSSSAISYVNIGIGSSVVANYWLDQVIVTNVEEYDFDSITESAFTDSYSAFKADDLTDEAYALGTTGGGGKLGKMRLGIRRQLMTTIPTGPTS